MKIQAAIQTELVLSESGVWTQKDPEDFLYSDGRVYNRYLESVLRKASDLSFRSAELQSYIRDWPSEYHLSSKRSNLLSGFTYQRSASVLEVGAGCGAISRFLGETFDSVISIEGNIDRANLAKLRTRDLDSVDVVCAPFQSLQFAQQFDLIYCIGVFEYSGMFVDAAQPYETVLRRLTSLLKPGGQLILAIENQFGMQYFASAYEDHTRLMFDGIEGYRRSGDAVRTFGCNEMHELLGNQWAEKSLYLPYPDYKLPSCVLDEAFVESGQAAELVSAIPNRSDYINYKSLFDTRCALFELGRNRLLPQFANSFLWVVRKSGGSSTQCAKFDQRAVLYSSDRRSQYQTRTTIQSNDGKLVTEKVAVNPELSDHPTNLTLKPCSDSWVDGHSVETGCYMVSRRSTASYGEIFSEVKKVTELLKQSARHDNTHWVLPNHYLDATWSNLFLQNNQLVFIDSEWVSDSEVDLNYLFIRSAYNFFRKHKALQSSAVVLRSGATSRHILAAAGVCGLTLCREDFKHFVRREAALYSEVYGGKCRKHQRNISLFLWNYKVTKVLGVLNSRLKIGVRKISYFVLNRIR